MTHETAGDPVSGLKWTRRTTAKLADELRGLQHWVVSPPPGRQRVFSVFNWKDMPPASRPRSPGGPGFPPRAPTDPYVRD